MEITIDTFSVSVELDNLTDKMFKAIDDEIKSWYNDLKASTPVDSGDMKEAWKPLKSPKKLTGTWTMTNNAPHSIIIARGRRKLPNKNGTIRWYGSIQNGWGGGLSPFLTQLKRRIKNVDNISV